MTEKDPLIRRLAEANPVPPEEVEGESRSPGARDLLARLTQGDRPEVRGPRKSHRRARWVAVGSALLVVIVAVGLVLRGGSSSPATASEELRRAAAVAASRAPSTETGEYLFSKIRADQLTGSLEGDQAWSAVLPVVEKAWIAADGSGRIRSVFGEVRFLGARDRERWEATGSQEFPSGVSDKVFPAGALVYEDLPSLPTDVGELTQLLQQRTAAEEPPMDVSVFIRVGELLARSDASPELRAALFRVAAQLPGVELAADATDPIGRPGTAVAMTYSDSGARVRVLMFFDEQTSELLAQQRILLERASWVDAEPGTPLRFVAYLEAGRTDSTHGLPPPG